MMFRSLLTSTLLFLITFKLVAQQPQNLSVIIHKGVLKILIWKNIGTLTN